MRFWRPRLAIVVFWLIASGWLISSEIFPYWFAPRGSYRELFQGGLLVLDDWMRISWQGRPLGYLHAWLDSGTAADGRLVSRMLNQVVVMPPGRSDPVRLTFGATLDSAYSLTDFFADLRHGGQHWRLDGQRRTGDQFHVVMQTPQTRRAMDAVLPPETLIFAPLSRLPQERLAPGRAFNLRFFNPLTRGTEMVRITALPHDSESHNVFPIKIDYGGLEAYAWLDESGRLVREHIPVLGLTLERCAAADAKLPEAVAWDIGTGEVWLKLLRGLLPVDDAWLGHD